MFLRGLLAETLFFLGGRPESAEGGSPAATPAHIGKVLVLVTLSPSSEHSGDSLQSLQWAHSIRPLDLAGASLASSQLARESRLLAEAIAARDRQTDRLRQLTIELSSVELERDCLLDQVRALATRSAAASSAGGDFTPTRQRPLGGMISGVRSASASLGGGGGGSGGGAGGGKRVWR